MLGAGELAAAPPGVTMFGIRLISPAYDRTAGISLIVSLVSVVWRETLCTSTIGDSPVTTTVSCRAPTFSSALTPATKVPASWMSARRTVENPGRENVTVYVPPRRSMMRYCPSPSVVAVRTFSIKSGLVTSTVTPGRTAPLVSFTMPVMVAWAKAADGVSTSDPTRTRHAAGTLRMRTPLSGTGPFIGRLGDGPGGGLVGAKHYRSVRSG